MTSWFLQAAMVLALPRTAQCKTRQPTPACVVSTAAVVFLASARSRSWEKQRHGRADSAAPQALYSKRKDTLHVFAGLRSRVCMVLAVNSNSGALVAGDADERLKAANVKFEW